jgi:predicted DNA-binding transcriptional regulator YafY
VPAARPGKPVAAPAPPDPAVTARALLAAPDSAAGDQSPTLRAVRAAAVNLDHGSARILAHAIDERQPALIEYVNQDGNHSVRVIADLELVGSSISAWCHLREDQRWFNIGRIVGVQPVTDSETLPLFGLPTAR